jgi:hypothetical protein
MIKILRHLFRCETATAAVEAAIFAPIFLTLTLGITDLGTGMFVQMTVNAATQAGASYAVINYGSVCASLTTTCLNGIKAAMDDAVGNSSFCTATAQNPTPCPISFTSCADPNGGICFIVSANYPFSPILPVASGIFTHSWTQTQTYSSTVTVRVPTT